MSEPIDAFEADPRNSTHGDLDELFRTADPRPIETLINEGGREIDVDEREVHNDEHWRGFFPTDHIVTFANRFTPLSTGFHKRFWTEDGSLVGVTTDADEVVVGHNRLREVERNGRPYVLLTYTDLVYRPFYDLLLPVSEDLAVGKAFFGRFPWGIELLTFGLTRRYGFDFLSPTDHEILWNDGDVPETEAIAGTWNLQLISNAGLTFPLYELQFEETEYGLDGQYEAFDTVSSDFRIDFTDEQMELFDITNWHDEIRQVTEDFMVGKYCQTETQVLPAPEDASLGYVHAEMQNGDERLCLYYVLNSREELIGEA